MYNQSRQRSKFVQSHAPQSFGATTAVTGEVIDRLGFDTLTVAVNRALPSQTAGSGTPTGTLTLTFVEGATSSPVTAVTLKTAVAAIDVAAAGVEYFTFDLTGVNRYLKVVATAALAAAGGGNTPLELIGITAELSDANSEPQPSAVTIYAKA